MMSWFGTYLENCAGWKWIVEPGNFSTKVRAPLVIRLLRFMVKFCWSPSPLFYCSAYGARFIERNIWKQLDLTSWFISVCIACNSRNGIWRGNTDTESAIPKLWCPVWMSLDSTDRNRKDGIIWNPNAKVIRIIKIQVIIFNTQQE